MNRSRTLAAALGTLALPAVLLAAEPGGDHAGVVPAWHQALPAMVTALVVFIIVLGVMGSMVWPRINKGLADREEKIRNEIEAAEMAQQQAKAALQQYEKNLADARAEAQQMLEQAKAQQQALAADLKAKAEAELNAMRERAKRDIDSAARTAINEIYAEAANLATAVAAKIIQRELNPGDQRRLVDESLSKIQSAGLN